MFEEKRLHPTVIFFNFIKALKEAIFPIGAGFFAFKDDTFIYFVLVTAVFLIGLIIFSILSWYRYTYRIEDGELRIEYGVFVRKKRYIPKNRVQSIDLTEGVIHRLFKLVSVKIETASSGTGAEGSLKAVKLSEGVKLREELKEISKQESMSVEETKEEISKPTSKLALKQLFLAGTTSGSVGIIFAIIALFFSEMEQFIPDDFYDSTYQMIIKLSITVIIVLAVAILLLIWLLGIAGTMIKYGNFTITRNNGELFITRGLLEKKQLTIPLKRIQAIGIDESIIRQPLGYATLYAEVAGGSLEKGEDFSSVLFPIIKTTEIDAFLQKFLPEYVSNRDELIELPKQAKKFYFLRSMYLFIFLIAGVVYWLLQFSWVPLLLLIASMYLGYLRFQDGGFRLDDEQLTIRYRRFNRKTVVVFHKRVQAFEKNQHWVQRGQKLATPKLSIVSDLGGRHYKLKDIDDEDVNRLAVWYSYR
ncbi:PH domain-containing protein [Virgibacillus ndiopensis]|uniref:PH domain-containing protein n=1 Tax=Virgibacillus ndiopensis TaxID=2004408 RepID=UPI000C084E4B|nr:PH domain-containing protein [Virgibacillus ndiopensis]